MSRFLIDENVNQKAVRTVPSSSKGFDVLLPESGGYKGAEDITVIDRANAEQRVLVSQEKDFGKFRLRPEDVPYGAIWLRPDRGSQQQIGELLTGLCKTLTEHFPKNPYNFERTIVEVYRDHVDIRIAGGNTNSYAVPTSSPRDAS